MKQQGFIRDDPAAGATIKAGGRYEDEDGEVTIPTDQEMRDIYAAPTGWQEERLCGEVLGPVSANDLPCRFLRDAAFGIPGLPWSNLSDGRILVRQRADRTGIIGPVKSKAGRRTIYVPTLVTDMIFEWQERCPDSS